MSTIKQLLARVAGDRSLTCSQAPLWIQPRAAEKPLPDITSLVSFVRVLLALVFVLTAVTYRAGWVAGAIATAMVIVGAVAVKTTAALRHQQHSADGIAARPVVLQTEIAA
jgi:hypothetical protein